MESGRVPGARPGTRVAGSPAMPKTRRSAVAAMVASLMLPIAVGAQPSEPPPPRGLSADVLKQIVDSARPDHPAPLTLANRQIVVFRAAVLDRTSAQRAAAARQLLTAFASEGRMLSVGSRALAGGMLISVDDRDVFALVPADNDPLVGETLPDKAQETVRRLQQALDESLESTRPRVLLVAFAQAVAATAVFVSIVWLLVRARRSASDKVAGIAAKTLSGHRVAEELARQLRLAKHLERVVLVVTVAAALVLSYIWLTFVLRRFPYTRPWGEALRSFLVEELTWLGGGILAALPSLFTILLIVLFTRLAIRGVRLLFGGVEEGRLTIPWVHSETASSTRKIVTVLLWLFALIVSYPYLPGSDTDAFKGVSVFIGLIVSLGSSGLVNQVMSGFTVTYSRALRRGDFVRVGEIEGTVTHIGTLSTKIETPRREDVTIPNAVLVAQVVVNYSRNADTTGVYTGTVVTIGYDAPWRQVEALLLLAASRTDGVRSTPAPVVLQSGLAEFHIRYTLLVALDAPHRRAAIFNRLHANIQDAFNEHGVQIMTPNYEADPESRKVVPKDRWFSAPAAETKETVTSRS
jgi:small-conductance mechanosensitive channel